MEVKEAIKKAESSSDVRKLRGYFLCSCFVSLKRPDDKINEWMLFFYNPATGMMLDCFVGESVIVGNETPPIAPVSDVDRKDFEDIRIGARAALDNVVKDFKKPTINVLITLHKKESMVWTISMVTADFMATSFDIDAKNGKLIDKKDTSFMQKL